MTHRDTHEDREGRVRWKRDGVQEHGANSDNSNKSDVLRPHTVSSSVCASHPNPSHAPLKTWNLCRQLNLLTLWPLYPPPPPEWNTTGKRKWHRHGGERSTQTMHFKCEGARWMVAAAVGSSMFLLVKESRIAYFHHVWQICLIRFSCSLRLGAIIGLNACLRFGSCSHLQSLKKDYLCFVLVCFKPTSPVCPLQLPMILATGTNGSKQNSRGCQAKDGYP